MSSSDVESICIMTIYDDRTKDKEKLVRDDGSRGRRVVNA